MTQTVENTATVVQPALMELLELLGPEVGDTAPSRADLSDRSVTAPDGVLALVEPRDVEQVRQVLRWADAHRVPVVPRGAGTGLSGAGVGIPGGIVLSTRALNRILEINPGDGIARVEPGVLGADLDAALRPHGLRYAPDPASWRISSLGGNVATNAGGLRCAKYGVTRESVLALDVVLADGSLISTGHRSIKGVTGLDLTSLFVGSEGTLGVVVGITVKVQPRPVEESAAAAWSSGVGSAAAGLARITASPARPAVLELLDSGTLEGIDAHSGTSLRASGAVLVLAQTDGFGAATEAEVVATALRAAGAQARTLSADESEFLFELRRSGRGPVLDKSAVGEDVAVPRSAVGPFLLELRRIADEHGVSISTVAHVGDGNFHPLVAGTTPQAVTAAADDVVRTALRLGGTISGEHGIGTAKKHWLPLEQDPLLRSLQHGIKAVLDPHGILNPGRAY